MKTRLTFAAISAVLAIALAGCGERPQVVEYKQGTYSGKPDTSAVGRGAVRWQQAGLGECGEQPGPGAKRVQAHQLRSRA